MEEFMNDNPVVDAPVVDDSPDDEDDVAGDSVAGDLPSSARTSAPTRRQPDWFGEWVRTDEMDEDEEGEE